MPKKKTRRPRMIKLTQEVWGAVFKYPKNEKQVHDLFDPKPEPIDTHSKSPKKNAKKAKRPQTIKVTRQVWIVVFKRAKTKKQVHDLFDPKPEPVDPH